MESPSWHLRVPLLLIAALALSLLIRVPAVPAQCLLVSGAGDDNYVCASGTSGALTDTLGSNTLTFPAGGTGEISGNVTFGDGTDTIEMQSGEIDGDVDQGNGVDIFEISAGTVTGNVQQGDGEDDFTMTGGQIQSLNQGGNQDEFFMSDGWIVGFFDDGDNATMTGAESAA